MGSSYYTLKNEDGTAPILGLSVVALMEVPLRIHLAFQTLGRPTYTVIQAQISCITAVKPLHGLSTSCSPA
jgi:hypothetical protein